MFELSGQEVRRVAERQPQLITYNLHHIKTNTFVIKEEMGFAPAEVKLLLLNKPKLWKISECRNHYIFAFYYFKLRIKCLSGTVQVTQLMGNIVKKKQSTIMIDNLYCLLKRIFADEMP